jgi:hypothetical protein
MAIQSEEGPAGLLLSTAQRLYYSISIQATSTQK